MGEFAKRLQFAVLVSTFELPPFPNYHGLLPLRKPLQIPAYAIAGLSDNCRKSCERVAVESFGLSCLSEVHEHGHTAAFAPSAALRNFLEEQRQKNLPVDERMCF